MGTEWRSLHLVVLCTAFVIAGPALILLNNTLLHDLGFPYPIALSAFGVLFSAFVCRTLVLLRLARLSQPERAESYAFFFRIVLPVAALSAITLALGNSAYVHLTVATCQILKSLTPALTLLLLYALRVEQPSLTVSVCVGSMCLGTAIAVQGELSLSRFGLLLQMGANLAEALRVVISQQLLTSLNLPLLDMQYYVAPWQALGLLLASLAFELHSPVERAAALSSVTANPAAFTLASVLGLALQAASLLVIKAAGSVTVKILGIARNSFLVIFQGLRGAEQVSATQLLGHTCSSIAFVAYTRVRLAPTRQPAQPHPKTQ